MAKSWTHAAKVPSAGKIDGNEHMTLEKAKEIIRAYFNDETRRADFAAIKGHEPNADDPSGAMDIAFYASESVLAYGKYIADLHNHGEDYFKVIEDAITEAKNLEKQLRFLLAAEINADEMCSNGFTA